MPSLSVQRQEPRHQLHALQAEAHRLRMKLSVITPVGPGHKEFVLNARASVSLARYAKNCKFTEVRHVVIDDHEGRMGRSRARNLGMTEDADWFFFLDADDRMMPQALSLCDFRYQATFGTVFSRCALKKITSNIYPCGWQQIREHGAKGTLSMGFFCRADVARKLRFDERLDAGEDFDFYMRLDNFIKIDKPLADIGTDIPSATGPRGYESIDWSGVYQS